MQPTTSDLERPMLRMGSVAFLAGLVIIIASTLFHASSEDLMDNPVVFEVYAESNTWIAAHIGQFAGVMLVFAGGFVALFRLLVGSESGTASALAWFGLVTAILTKHNTNFNISISVRSLCVSYRCVTLSFSISFDFKSCSNFSLSRGAF